MSHPPFQIENILASLSTPSPLTTAEEEAELLEPFTYIARTPGKRVCTQFIHAFDHWLQVPPAQLEKITYVVELLHDATLVIDDIEDDSDLRRGKPAAHKVYGVPQTINSANYVYFLAYQHVLKMPRSGIRHLKILNDEMLSLHRGQGKDMRWRDRGQCPTEEEYVHMVNDKAAGILRLAVRLMAEFATINRNVDYVPFAELLGIWYQIRDDYMNLQSDVYTEKKGLAEDLSEGKFSFPIIHGIRKEPESNYIQDILHQRPKSPTLKVKAITYLDKVTHSFEYTRGVLDSLELQARAEVKRLGGNPILDVILDKLGTKN